MIGTYQKRSGRWGYTLFSSRGRKRQSFGDYETELEAARARDQHIKTHNLFRKGIVLNFPDYTFSIDPQFETEVMKHRWCKARDGYWRTYVKVNGKQTALKLHAFVYNISQNRDVTDKQYTENNSCLNHIDHDTNNNRISNLEVCTRMYNNSDKGQGKYSSCYIGVCRKRDKWSATLQHNKQQYCLGSFDTPEEAARARDTYIRAQGWDLKLNFPA